MNHLDYRQSKVLIGLTTYGPIPRAQHCIETIKATTNIERREGLDFQIAIADDTIGGGYDNMDRRMYCKRENVTLLEGNTIGGIPAAWNKLIKFGKEQKCDIITIVSDGIRFMVDGWLKRMVWFLQNNENIGTVGTPTVGDPKDYYPNQDRWMGVPGRVGASVGCSFSERIDIIEKLVNPDGSIGYWEDLLSFHEEIHAGLTLSGMGYLSYMLPFPPSYYRGGMAFGTHPELIWRRPSPYLPVEDFIKYHRMCELHVKEFEPLYEKGQVDKMSYSRIMACKAWGILNEVDAGRQIQNFKGEEVDIIKDSPKFYHARTVDIHPLRIIKYLDLNWEIAECNG